MADLFDDETRIDLEERGFTNGQIEILESFERDKYGLHSDIEKMMDDYNMTPDEIMSEYNNDENPDEVPQQGGKRRSRRSRKNKKGKRSRKNKKTKRNKKSRRSRRR